MQKEVEILSPAGSYECLKAAVAAGADAVYVGGSRFGARAFADNFSEEELLDAIDYVHLCGRKIYLAVNTLLKEKELTDDFYNYLLPYYQRGIDAVIVQDIGVLQFVKKHFPNLPIHASTQMTITNYLGVQFLEKLGVERVVTSRELQLDEIREIAEHTNLEIESFVHGALCYSYSGQCLYSSLIGGRSGNRGQCAQPCRLPYCIGKDRRERYLLSLKDICTLDIIPDMVEAGIYSFKIEGRMKKPEYVALVTAVYRKYVDLYLEVGREGYHVSEQDKLALMDLYNRGGFHTGYYRTRNGRDMVSIMRPNHAGVEVLRVTKHSGRDITARVLTELSPGDVVELPNPKENYTFSKSVKKGEEVHLLSHKRQDLKNVLSLYRVRNERLIQEIQKNIIGQFVKTSITGRIFLALQQPICLEVSDGKHIVKVQGGICEPAVSQPAERERIEKQLRKTGNTPFVFTELDVKLQGNLFVPMQVLNELRRNALEELEQKILADFRREEPVLPSVREDKEEVVASTEALLYSLVRTEAQFKAVCAYKKMQRIYLDANMLPSIWKRDCSAFIEKAHNSGKEIFLAMPHIFRKNTRNYYYSAKEFMENEWDGMLLRNYEEYEFLQSIGYKGKIAIDHHLYVFNRKAKEFWMNHGADSVTVPHELNMQELRNHDLSSGELVIYGYQPMMISAQCVLNTTEGCTKKPSERYIEDRYHKKFMVANYCDYCYNVIYNTLPLALFDQKEQIYTLAPKAVRLEFVNEDETQVERVLECYQTCKEPDFAFTRGHFKRGIK